MRVLIVYDHPGDAAPPDQADALTQARDISAALDELGHEWVTLGVTPDLHAARDEIERLQPDLVFNLVESLGGHGRLIHAVPALLDAIGVRYTGAAAEAQFITSHKTLAKQLMLSAGVHTPRYHTRASLAGTGRHAATAPAWPPRPVRWIIKSLWEHASVGIDADSVIEAGDSQHLLREIERRLDQLGGDGFAEEYIDGREFNISLLDHGRPIAPGRCEPQVLRPAEIVFGEPARWGSRPRIVNYDCKWNEHSFEHQHTQRVFDFIDDDRALLGRLADAARACWAIFELRGYARVDFRVDAPGTPWVLEVNTNPCLSRDAGFAAALERASIPYSAAIDRIVSEALTRSPACAPTA